MLNNPTEDDLIEFLLTQGLNDTTVHKELNELLVEFREQREFSNKRINKELLRRIKIILHRKEYDTFEKNSKISRLTALEKSWNDIENKRIPCTHPGLNTTLNDPMGPTVDQFGNPVKRYGMKWLDRDTIIDMLCEMTNKQIIYIEPKVVDSGEEIKLDTLLEIDKEKEIFAKLNKDLDDAVLKEKEFSDNKLKMGSVLDIPISELKKNQQSTPKAFGKAFGFPEFDSKFLDALHKKDNTVIPKTNSDEVIGDYNTSSYDAKIKKDSNTFNLHEINCLLKY